METEMEKMDAEAEAASPFLNKCKRCDQLVVDCIDSGCKEEKEGILRVWWSSRVPIDNSLETYQVSSPQEAKTKLDELTQRDLKDSSVMDNVGGLEVFESGEWCEWSNERGDDICAFGEEDDN